MTLGLTMDPGRAAPSAHARSLVAWLFCDCGEHAPIADDPVFEDAAAVDPWLNQQAPAVNPGTRCRLCNGLIQPHQPRTGGVTYGYRHTACTLPGQLPPA